VQNVQDRGGYRGIPPRNDVVPLIYNKRNSKVPHIPLHLLLKNILDPPLQEKFFLTKLYTKIEH
jgi:hypothetical protein